MQAYAELKDAVSHPNCIKGVAITTDYQQFEASVRSFLILCDKRRANKYTHPLANNAYDEAVISRDTLATRHWPVYLQLRMGKISLRPENWAQITWHFQPGTSTFVGWEQPVSDPLAYYGR